MKSTIDFASGIASALFAAGETLVGVAARLLEASGLAPRQAPKSDDDPPPLRALTGGMAARTRSPETRRDDESGAPRPRRRVPLDDGAVPERYDEDRVVVRPRDPCTVHVYWSLSEATRAQRAANADRLLRDAVQIETRASDLDAQSDAASANGGATWIVPLAPLADATYLDLPSPCDAVRVTFGWLEEDGAFVPRVASTWVRMPPAGPAAEEAPRWRQLASPSQEPVEPPPLPSREARDALLRRAQETLMWISSAERPAGHPLETEPSASPERG
ncbi:MAG TPA: DUF4912 domain-containing protein [Candidatus Binatia bacterium]